MAKKSYRRTAKRSVKRTMKTHRKRTHRMRGGADNINAPTTSGNLVLPQGVAYYPNSPMGMAMKGGMSKDAYGVYGSEFYGMKPVTPMQQGGSAPYPGSVEGVRLLTPGQETAAGTGRIDAALQQVAGLRDPNQTGGRKRKSKKSTRKTKKSRKSNRKTRKSRKSRKAGRKGRKAHRRGRKAQRGGEMPYDESMNGGILPSDLADKAGLHRSWSDVAAGRMV